MMCVPFSVLVVSGILPPGRQKSCHKMAATTSSLNLESLGAGGETHSGYVVDQSSIVVECVQHASVSTALTVHSHTRQIHLLLYG